MRGQSVGHESLVLSRVVVGPFANLASHRFAAWAGLCRNDFRPWPVMPSGRWDQWRANEGPTALNDIGCCR
jgi:hypothetical protein